MPCMSYESERDEANTALDEVRRLRKINDRLARIACKSLTLLETISSPSAANEIAVLMADKEVRAWWPKHKEADQRRKAAEREALEAKVRKEGAKKRILASVNPEDLAELGIKL